MATCLALKSSGKKRLEELFQRRGRDARAPGARQRHQDHRHIKVALMIGGEDDGPADTLEVLGPATRTQAKMRPSGKIHVAWLKRRMPRTIRLRFHDGKSTGSATSACCGAAVTIDRSSSSVLAPANFVSSMRVWNDLRAPPSVPPARAAQAESFFDDVEPSRNAIPQIWRVTTAADRRRCLPPVVLPLTQPTP